MNTQTPPHDPLLVPDAPANQNAEHRLVEIKNARVRSHKRKARAPKAKPPLYTLEDAYLYNQEDPDGPERNLDIEKAVRACSYLLDWATYASLDKVDGRVTVGISKLLEICAELIKRDREHWAFVKRRSEADQTKAEE